MEKTQKIQNDHSESSAEEEVLDIIESMNYDDLDKEIRSLELQFMHIVSAGCRQLMFSGRPAVSMLTVYKESERKYRLDPGDILVLVASHPFVMEILVLGRVPSARLLSWAAFNFPSFNRKKFKDFIFSPLIRALILEEKIAQDNAATAARACNRRHANRYGQILSYRWSPSKSRNTC